MYECVCVGRCFIAMLMQNIINITATTPLPLLFEFFRRQTLFFLVPQPDLSWYIYAQALIYVVHDITIYNVCIHKHPPKQSCFIIVYPCIIIYNYIINMYTSGAHCVSPAGLKHYHFVVGIVTRRRMCNIV